MADLLGSILSSMEKPPTIGEEEKKKAKKQREQLEKLQAQEKAAKSKFRKRIVDEVNKFINDSSRTRHKFEAMDKMARTIVHDVVEVAGLTSFSFGEDENDRYVMLFKKEFAPSDEELEAYRRGEEWDPNKAEEIKRLKEAQVEEASSSQVSKKVVPISNYKDKYKHLIGDTSAKAAAQITTANKAYGFVPSENKRDQRSIEEVQNQIRAKKRQKTDDPTAEATQSSSNEEQ
ncbi:SPAG7 [Branchiostoma lanceolatum]|uniref:SPAG7 protein n=1 Tax=Branchiostoma lanceolatum TaxID=7740 RepID=A0A8J9YS29_BRALA|nr:SPAG7 [Branchiostoma lanceolatum]